MNQHTPTPVASPRLLIQEAITGLEQKFGADAVFSECIKLMEATEIMRRNEHPSIGLHLASARSTQLEAPEAHGEVF